jgi:hypothetical protein
MQRGDDPVGQVALPLGPAPHRPAEGIVDPALLDRWWVDNQGIDLKQAWHMQALGRNNAAAGKVVVALHDNIGGNRARKALDHRERQERSGLWDVNMVQVEPGVVCAVWPEQRLRGETPLAATGHDMKRMPACSEATRHFKCMSGATKRPWDGDATCDIEDVHS